MMDFFSREHYGKIRPPQGPREMSAAKPSIKFLQAALIVRPIPDKPSRPPTPRKRCIRSSLRALKRLSVTSVSRGGERTCKRHFRALKTLEKALRAGKDMRRACLSIGERAGNQTLRRGGQNVLVKKILDVSVLCLRAGGRRMYMWETPQAKWASISISKAA